MRFKIFISSVQSEFAKERKALASFVRSDLLLKTFFEVFLFEEVEACDRTARAVYLDEVRKCDLYLGLFGRAYGNVDAAGVSPTEREFDLATELAKPMQWAGYVEKAGTGTTDIIEKCVACGLRKPEYAFDGTTVKLTIWRTGAVTSHKGEVGRSSQDAPPP